MPRFLLSFEMCEYPFGGPWQCVFLSLKIGRVGQRPRPQSDSRDNCLDDGSYLGTRLSQLSRYW